MIIIIFGGLGEGKTALGVNIVYRNRDKYRIMSNVKLNFPYQHIEFEEIMQHISDPEYFRNSWLFIDEIHNLIDARKSGSQMNLDFTRFITQVGKINCQVLITTQILSSQVDLRVRELGNLYIFVTKVNAQGQPQLFAERKSTEKVLIKGRAIAKFYGGLEYAQTEFMFDPTPVFPLYNTEQILIFNSQDHEKNFWHKRKPKT